MTSVLLDEISPYFIKIRVNGTVTRDEVEQVLRNRSLKRTRVLKFRKRLSKDRHQKILRLYVDLSVTLVLRRPQETKKKEDGTNGKDREVR